MSRITDGAQKWVSRLEVCFAAENPFDFARRVADAFARRREAEEVLQYNLYVDAMPTEDVPPLDQGQLSRMLSNALSTKALKSPGDKEVDDFAVCQHHLRHAPGPADRLGSRILHLCTISIAQVCLL